ncbi:MAG: class I SAM-dependent methyltransferase [Syntrophobacterales bacterium]|jgi:ubiquinone/menaquinone biosynthesis C-methylase UbiE
MEKWFAEHGIVFLQDIGIQEGQYILDFGCGEGYYTIPAAIVVDGQGKIYAVDKDKEVLTKLSERARSIGLDNIVFMNCKRDLKVDLGNESVDAVLLYDVLHYIRQRKDLYEEVYRVLKKKGILSVYPKHCKSDFPMWCLADLEIEDVIEEIDAANFRFEEKSWNRLVHFGGYAQGYVLRFIKE